MTTMISLSSATPSYPYIAMKSLTLLLTAFAIVSPNALAFAAETAADRPNIVFILSDDQAYTDYGFMGHPQIKTPHLDKLAARSALFTHSHVPTALCRPSLATLVSGLYAHQHKISGNDPSPALAKPKSPEYDALREQLISHVDRIPIVPRLLSQNGYLTFQSGKWWEGSYKRGGFTHGMTRGFPQPGGRHGDDGLKIGRTGLQPVFDFVDMALEQKKPFFVWYAPIMPHSPHTPPERLLAKYADKVDSIHVARYYAMCEWFDETCGELIDYIDAKGQTNNTLFVYIADNGWIQRTDSPAYAPRSKQSPNEGGVRQPILLSWPGVISPQKRADYACSIDIAPTMLAAAKVEAPKNLPGIDLLPYVRQQKKLNRDSLYGEVFSHDIADINQPEASLLFRWVIDGRWKLILVYDGAIGSHPSGHELSDNRPRLYDLEADPTEKSNLAADNPEVVARLAKKIADWWPVQKRKTITQWSGTN